MNTLTARQSDMMSFIQSFQAERGFGPSYREIAEALDLRSVGNVYRMVTELEGRGVLRKPRHEARSYQLIGEPGAERHLKAILAEVGRAGAVHQDALCVIDAMRFLGGRAA